MSKPPLVSMYNGSLVWVCRPGQYETTNYNQCVSFIAISDCNVFFIVFSPLSEFVIEFGI